MGRRKESINFCQKNNTFDVLLQRLELTSRMKDFFDIYNLASIFDFDGQKLQQAIYATLTNRGTPYERDSLDKVIALSGYADMQTRWRQYLKSAKLPKLTLKQALTGIDVFLRPVWDATVKEVEILKTWNAIDGV